MQVGKSAKGVVMGIHGAQQGSGRKSQPTKELASADEVLRIAADVHNHPTTDSLPSDAAKLEVLSHLARDALVVIDSVAAGEARWVVDGKEGFSVRVVNTEDAAEGAERRVVRSSGRDAWPVAELVARALNAHAQAGAAMRAAVRALESYRDSGAQALTDERVEALVAQLYAALARGGA